MTTETFTPASPYTISGTGPYAIPFEYSDRLDVLVQLIDGQTVVPVSSFDYTITPTSNASSGNLTLTAGAAASFAGKLLFITRQTRLEQGWIGSQTSREKGLERQIDINTRHGQDLERSLDRVPRLPLFSDITDPVLPEPVPGALLIATSSGWTNGPTVDSFTQGAAATVEFTSVASLLAYAALPRLLVGTTVRTRQEGFSYTVVSSGQHLTTAGGDRLVVQRGANGFNVKAFGATGNGATDDIVAIQRAMDAAKPTGNLERSTAGIPVRVYFPTGTYMISTFIKQYTGIIMCGDGVGTLIKKQVTFTGTALVYPDDGGLTPANRAYCHMRDLSFDVLNASGIWVFDGEQIGNGGMTVMWAENIRMYGSNGFNMPNTQSSYFRLIRAERYTDCAFNISGNWNMIEYFNKENATGVSGLPIIRISNDYTGGAYNNTHVFACRLSNLLIEGGTGTTAYPIQIINADDIMLENVWVEETNTFESVGIYVDGSTITMKGKQTVPSTNRKLKLVNKSTVKTEWFKTIGEGTLLSAVVDVSADSILIADEYNAFRGNDVWKLDSPNIRIGRESRLQTVDGIIYNTVDFRPDINLLQNPSYEAGIFGWATSGAPTVTFEASEIGPGLMAKVVATVVSSLTQNITIPAQWVGRLMTLSMPVRVEDGEASLSVFGAGLSSIGVSPRFYDTVPGWQIMTSSFRPTAAGSLQIGTRLNTAGTCYFDDCLFTFGNEGARGGFRAEQIELGSRSFLVRTAAPTTGTWKVGDRVFNSAPAVGSPKSWVCTVAGTPGTWVSEGNL